MDLPPLPLRSRRRRSGVPATTVLLVLALVLPESLWLGLFGSIIWRWFVVPLGAPPIGVLAAAGLGLVVVYFAPTPNREGQSIGEAFAETLVAPPILFAHAWLLHLLLTWTK